MPIVPPHRRQFVRDAAVATVLVGGLIALYRLAVDPWILRLPGMVLWIPVFVLYNLLGGGMENALGPSPIHIGAYSLFVGGTVGWLAGGIRRSGLVDQRPRWQSVAASALLAGVTLVGLFVVGPQVGVVGPLAAMTLAVFLGVGLVVVAVVLWVLG